MGFAKFDDIVGRTDLLEVNKEVTNWKMKNVDFSKLLYVPKEAKKIQFIILIQMAAHNGHLDFDLIKDSKKAIRGGKKYGFHA